MMNANALLRMWVSQHIVRDPSGHIPIAELLERYKKFATDPIPNDWVIDGVAFSFADSEVKDNAIWGITWRRPSSNESSNESSNVPGTTHEPEKVVPQPEPQTSSTTIDLADLIPGSWYVYRTSWGGPFVSQFVESKDDVYEFTSVYHIKKEHLMAVHMYTRKPVAVATVVAEEVKA